jgi:hypothetical protein
MTAGSVRTARTSAAAAELEQFLSELETSATHASEAAGGFHDVYLRIAKRDVRLRFAGAALVETIAPAFEHLIAQPGAGRGLVVHLWDSESTGTPPPPSPVALEAEPFFGRIPRLCCDTVYTELQWRTHALTAVDTSRKEAFYWVRSAAKLAGLEGAFPLLSLLNAWLGRMGIQLVHASAVGWPGGCVLVVGKKGAGKSAVALACLQSNLQFIADDYCAVRPGTPPEVFSLFGTANAHRDTLERLPFLAPIADAKRRYDDKVTLSLQRHRSDCLLVRAPLRAVVVPRITRRHKARISPTRASVALTALAPSTIMQLAEGSQTTLHRLGTIVRGVRCYQLDAGADPTEVARAIASVLEP